VATYITERRASTLATAGSTARGIANSKKLPDTCLVCAEQVGDQNAIDLHAGQIGVGYRRIREIDIGKRDFGEVDASEIRVAKINFLKAAVDQIGIGKM